MRRGLGDVPIAVLEKGKAPGAHLVSGAVVNPGPLERLLPGKEIPFAGAVEKESVYFLTAGALCASRRRRRCATTATAWSRSLSSGGSSRARRRLGRDDPSRDRRRAAPRRRRHGSRGAQGDRGRGRDGSRFRPSSPGRSSMPRSPSSPKARRDTSPARRSSVRPARERAAGLGARGQRGLEGRAPARSRHPHDGLAAATAGAVPRVRRLVRLSARRRPRRARPRRRARLPRHPALGARPAAGAEDAPLLRGILAGGERVAWGARRSPRAAGTRCPSSCTRPGSCSAATASGS